ncbi:heparan-alpha-glucosaminide N-acetyltransferase isoform X4 [Oncorhynchus nerka]|uniref:heparan-alpha-glucosaminide N-acetyltransferase isoform X4 n=1 Tax=Oncorhynchus nerka TaxID=8023 RepID=UPI00113142D6|nr:heparan-alpha-glucosaminide N-acetyltransferase-like isoform X4 [Oncorhynchus nerka]
MEPRRILTQILCVFFLTTGRNEGKLDAKSCSGRPALKLDQACLTFHNQLPTGVDVLYTSDYCYKCLYQPLVSVLNGPQNASVVVSTVLTLTLQLQPMGRNTTLCSWSQLYEEAAHYSVWIQESESPINVICYQTVDVSPSNIYFRGVVRRSSSRPFVTKDHSMQWMMKPKVVGTRLTLPSQNQQDCAHWTLSEVSWSWLRIPGVLQRLGFTYFILSLMQTFCGMREIPLSRGRWWDPVQDVVLYWPEWIFIILLETLWLCLTFLLPVPNCPTGYLGAGGIGDNGLYPNCTGGAAGYIDKWLLGDNIYHWPTCKAMYRTTQPFDPEGVLGTINSIVMGFMGMQAGKILIFYRKKDISVLSRFLVWAILLGNSAAILSKCTRDEGFIPVNKNLWSLSYITCMGCFSFLLLGVMYFVMDIKGWWGGQPFIYPGMNSIFVYVGHSLLGSYFPFSWEMRFVDSHWEKLFQSLWATSLWVLIAFLLYRKKFFLKI